MKHLPANYIAVASMALLASCTSEMLFELNQPVAPVATTQPRGNQNYARLNNTSTLQPLGQLRPIGTIAPQGGVATIGALSYKKQDKTVSPPANKRTSKSDREAGSSSMAAPEESSGGLQEGEPPPSLPDPF